MKLYDDLVWRGLIKDFSSPDLIDKLNNEKLTGEDIKEILKEEVLNNIYTNDIEKIYEEVKDTKTNYEKLFEKYNLGCSFIGFGWRLYR